jgi:hypothetical protein
MIRRGFWLTIGAAGGIMAYRRLERLAGRSWARETIRFTRDVREGMGVYMDRHPGEVGPNLGADDENETKDDR